MFRHEVGVSDVKLKQFNSILTGMIYVQVDVKLVGRAINQLSTGVAGIAAAAVTRIHRRVRRRTRWSCHRH